MFDDLKDQNLMEIKKLADEGDVEKMYEYGRKRFIGDEDCQCDIQEAKKYISMAAEKGHEKAKYLLQIIQNDSSINDDKTKPQLEEEEQATSSTEQKPQTNNITHLKDDQFFTREREDVQIILNKVKENYNKIAQKKKDFSDAHLGKKRVPVLLEGPTGTSKTLSSEIFCQLIGKPLLKFNLSSETKASYLLGKYRGDVDSWSGLSMTEGPFRNAYENGYILLLDDINLASAECLKFISKALDSKKISVELPGMPLREIPMHPDFKLIATQNPNKGLFASKRQYLDPAFLSRFQIIDFPPFCKDELIEIAKGLAESLKYNASDQFIQDFVDFHMTWSSRDDVKGGVQCFTVREIAAAVHALSNGNNCYDTIMTIYGARYKKGQKNNLKELFLSYDSFKDMKPSEFEYPENFPECFHNKNLEEALKAIKFSFDNKRHVILTGSEGNGITQVARWVAEYFNNKNNNNKNNDEFFCVCTEETKCSDFIGCQKPPDNIGSSQELIVFKPGLLTLAIQQGKCVVFDSLDEVPSTVCERLNVLFDEKYDGEKKIFEIPENPEGEPIEIDPEFRMLCTCRIDKINQMSPAFVNRFDVIVLEDQLEDITDDKLKELIELLMKVKLTPSSHSTRNPNNDNNANNIEDQENDEKGNDDDIGDENEEEEDDLKFSIEDGLDEEDFPATNENEFKPSSELVDLVFNSFNQIKNETISNDDQTATMFKLSRLCKAVSKYVNLFSNISTEGSSGITQEKIVKFATDFVMKTTDFNIPKEIEDFFIQKLVATNNNDDGQYFFRDSPSLRSHIAKLYAASVINLPLVLIGGTGVGKTSSARAFGRLRRNLQNRSLPCSMLPFHAGTMPNNIYGTKTILNGKVAFVNGPLTTALQKGGTFIADEMNLSTISTMKSLAPALEPCIGEKIFIPGVGESVKIHPDFLFVACQDELGTIGRNAIPSSIASRFRVLYYPVQQEEEVSTICVDISRSFYDNSNIAPSFSLDDARNVGKYMIRLNQEKQKIIHQWSLRDVTKIFKRIHHQDEQCEYYQNITFYHNVLFYTLASVGKNELKEIFDTVLKLIGDTFDLDSNTRTKLKESYESEASIKNSGKGPYIMKGDIGVSTTLFPNFEKYVIEFSCLPSLLECIFQILLSDSSEPIILIGPTGYKTFISKIFLQKAKVIALSQETSVSQLIGSSVILTKTEAKHFYLDLICRICHIYDGSKIAELKDKLSKMKLVKSDITTETKAYLQFYPSFATTVHRLTEKLFENSTKNNDHSVLSDIVNEFRPGLILLPILQGDSIILKDLSNLQTIVIERFNELLTGKHNITVTEDIHDTITESDQKELSGFSSDFRVFGTCPPNSACKLSKAILSRFTVINTLEYKKDEQGNILKRYNIIYAKKLSEEIVELIIEFSISVQNHLKKTIPFTQLINILEICSRLTQTISSIPQKNILGIVLYRIFFGLLKRRTEYKEIINTIFNEINVPLPSQFLNPINEIPFLITEKDGFIGLESRITGLFIHSTCAKEVFLNVAFIPTFVDMVDIIHFGILAKIPVILEGNAGQGKQKSIEYVAKHLGYEVVNIFISKSTKVDDLLGKVSIEPDEKNNIHVKTNLTKLAKAIKSNSANNNTIFVWHNLNNASPAVLEKLVSLFDRGQSEFSFPDGTTHPKGEINVVCLFNPQNNISNREKLPTSLIYSSLYHIVENPRKQDVLEIIEALFQPTNFRNEVLSFHNKYSSVFNMVTVFKVVTLFFLEKKI
ncbi:hypothetical protein M9Y10_016685 [Tritrichomonas musculus]|uniref:ATPase dynein-related AAA domain-containing protein n=1 Tax=Tritrichomonas musculus TaxID=1915356 RepID=A0ABR2HYH3_9EUKA